MKESAARVGRRMSTGRLLSLLGAFALILATTACATTKASPATATGSAGATLDGNITVFAAASLTNAFQAVAKAFAKAHPGIKVSFSFAGSSTLALQINQGAPADVFASADVQQMAAVTRAGNALNPQTFVTNTPVVVVPTHDSAVKSFADLAKPGIRLVLAVPQVPIGQYARTILHNASGADGISKNFEQDVLRNLQSNEADVRVVLSKVELGEADAGIVYTTDAASAAGRVRQIPIPATYNVIATYPIAVVHGTSHPATAKAFVTFVLSPAGQTILKHYGFGPP